MHIDIHPASEEERLAAYRNVHEAWGGTLSREEFVERRLRSATHNRAQWLVLAVDGRVASSLGRYPLVFHYQGQLAPGSGIGAVHTLREYRGRGYAAALLRQVNAWSRDEGHHISMLFSDIDPGYYEQFGYVRWPALNFTAAPDALRSAAGELDLVPILPEPHLDLLAELYSRWHSPHRLYLFRDREYWQYSLKKNAAGEFFLAKNPQGKAFGYVRIRQPDTDTLQITEFALDRRDVSAEGALYAAVAALARQRQCTKVEGWLPDTLAARAAFTAAPRGKAITMLAPLDEAVSFDRKFIEQDSHFWFSDAF